MVAITVLLAVVLILSGALYGYGRHKVRMAEKRYPPRGEFVEADGVKLHFIRKGEGRPVVFLHGGVLTAEDYRETIDIAARSGYCGIAFDRPGYGYSERPDGERVTPGKQAMLLRRALIGLGIEKPILVAHSWSGVLALTYALEYPDDLAGIVTLGAGFYPQGYPAEKGDPISTIAMAPVLGAFLLRTLLPVVGPLLTNAVLRETFKPEPVPESYRQATLAYWLRPSQFRVNREDVLAFVPAAKAAMGRYKRIRTPLVIVVGGEDPFPTKEHSYRLHREIPDSDLIVLPHAAHMIPQNHPGDVMNAVRALSGGSAGELSAKEDAEPIRHLP
ncbi:alpha/beta hydrolase [Cohnella thailandensis]|uniref:Alpha/beta hydrolase n=1 Tax=Cohnella thailandensis TaxID=557557 RepID=A0A841T2I2_9BACL|nr:alpha/beta hydrolase [Cohnella thailandensis]MBB6636578.1 alpha/beta hydrolase [Cohnella thailandensis]MBP1973549.1 pimeloyl-ACP methyl ester carboxylesterase [Cohnella thailandensis]